MSTEASKAPAQRRTPVIAVLVAMRPKQWLKNVLVFAVPLAAGELLNVDVLGPSVMAFVVFCLISSATYLLNDVRDTDRDRAHPVKRFRPVAAGELAPSVALVLSAALAIVALGLALAVNPGLFAVVLAYAVFTVSYSLVLKDEPVIELALIALGFLLRAIAGGVASDLPISRWFLIVAGFGSLFMAAGKRFSELGHMDQAGEAWKSSHRRSLDGYTPSYLRFVWAMSAAVTITAYCLWAFEVSSEDSSLSWAALSVVPFVMAVLRYAVDVDRGEAEAPEDVVLKDVQLLVLGLIWLVLFALAALGV